MDEFAKKDAAALSFKVTWIGFWVQHPGQTLDPTKVADALQQRLRCGLSGIDTTEALVEGGKMAQAGKKVWTIPYDYEDACKEAEAICLGVPCFNWGAVLPQGRTDGRRWQMGAVLGLERAGLVQHQQQTPAVGFFKGQALKRDAANVDKFIRGPEHGHRPVQGAAQLQDGSAFLKRWQTTTDLQVWYLSQLLRGMEGPSR
ncbi:MAG: hypothetical protein IPO15_23530 [Anaerolineae bacterium]|uniref:hypothetical protein n=1 Tax=Candidatus Amarolinea dominans TaxID=3140696 RepID=UPI003134DBA1|nr:hypothetical protein [Anaerolineae bacterium]